MKIYNLGSLNIDYVYQVPHFVRAGETLSSSDMQIFPGGKGLNQSVALGRAGADVIHGGLAGQGDDWLIDVLRSSNVNTDYVRQLSQPTGHAIIQVDESGQNCILLFAGANHCFTPEYIEEVLQDAEPGDLLLLQNEINHLDVIFETAHKKQMQIVFNPSPFDKKLLDLPLSYVKWWLLNEIEGNELTGETSPEAITECLLQKYPESNIILTVGKDGSHFKNAERAFHVPAVLTKAVDTTAAGDTFTGYLLAMIAAGEDVEKVMHIAAKASSIAVSRMGASSSVPWKEEVFSIQTAK